MITSPNGSPVMPKSGKNSKQWSGVKPTVPGWYWIRTQGTHEIVRVVEEDAGKPNKCALLVPIEPGGEGETMELEQMDVEWCGPLDVPCTSAGRVAA